MHICGKSGSFQNRVQKPPAPMASLQSLPIPGRQNSLMGCDLVLMESGKLPDSKISELGAGRKQTDLKDVQLVLPQPWLRSDFQIP